MPSYDYGEGKPLTTRGLSLRAAYMSREQPSRPLCDSCQTGHRGTRCVNRSSARTSCSPQPAVTITASRRGPRGASRDREHVIFPPARSTGLSSPPPSLNDHFAPIRQGVRRYVTEHGEFEELADLVATARAAETSLTLDALRDACADLYALVNQTAVEFAEPPQASIFGVDADDRRGRKQAFDCGKDAGSGGAWAVGFDRATDLCHRPAQVPDGPGAVSHSGRSTRGRPQEDDLTDISDLDLDACSDELDLRARFPDLADWAYRSPTEWTPRVEAVSDPQ